MIAPRHTHKRSSSQWVPPSAPLHNPITVFRGRSSREKGSRMIQPNHLFDEPRYELSNFRQFTDNSITTTKYSLLTFIPYNIFHQMTTKYANLYFLFIAVLNFCPVFGAYTKFLGLIPIGFVLCTTLVKVCQDAVALYVFFGRTQPLQDGYEDFRRWRFDNKINSKTCHVWDRWVAADCRRGSGRDRHMFRKMFWKHILVGDFVHVSNEQEIPADLLFLRSSDENGTCFIETCNLDGETSLKQRLVPRQYVDFSKPNSNFTPPMFTGTIFSEPPDPAIYTIRARIEYAPDSKCRCSGQFEVIVKDNMLLRGHDTKVMMNNGRAPHKISGIEQLTNRFIIVCMILLAVMVFSSSLMSGIWSNEHPLMRNDSSVQINPYIAWNSPKPLVDGLYNIGAFLICYQVIVPISLYITVEIIKGLQIFFLSQDIRVQRPRLPQGCSFVPPTCSARLRLAMHGCRRVRHVYGSPCTIADDRKIDCRSLNIPEELGQVSHVLSDKTGTLTENIMVFRNCAFDRFDYGPDKKLTECDPSKPVASAALQERVKSQWHSNPTMRHFFLNMILNNSVVVNKVPHQDALEVSSLSSMLLPSCPPLHCSDMQVGFFEHGVYSIGNSSFYDITAEQYEAMIEQLKGQPPQPPSR
ncbi:unnamed protein product [Heligmosomoides polygyrus]|uniref:PhoLip_ATPase_N domain-containing protein n=1 Tax=Heligmosomoides polygyrus TaxID=6339 RepID=A0A3P8AFR6_HELPZ|nr:unnamed protein product [Heligmosomoides polygyrus]